MILEIPLDSTVAQFKQVCSIEGLPYIFDLSWSERGQSWYLSLYLQTSGAPDPIAVGIRLSPGWPLLMGVNHNSRPPGDFFALDLNGAGDPARGDLGTRVRLYYFDRAALGG